jgi:radical SAM protein with 4Fe4S-binding SPASM domain
VSGGAAVDRADSANGLGPRRLSLGLGLTSACNLSCSFCYRDPTRDDRLSLEQVKAVLAALPVRAVNLGTGENGMHPEFPRLLDWLSSQDVKLTITSNGHSAAVLADEQLRRFHDVELSLDHPTEAAQDSQRGPGNWRLLLQQAERCVRLGVPVTFIAVMMRANHLALADVARVAARFGAPLRVNVYQPVRSDAFALSYAEYWDGFERLFDACDAITLGEPLVRAMAGWPPRTGGCGAATVRVTPRGTVQPCVYWPGAGAPLATLLERGAGVLETEPFREARRLPAACAGCPVGDACGGGCAGRRALAKVGRDDPDPYCPVVRGEARRLVVRRAAGRDLPKAESACTTIVVAH